MGTEAFWVPTVLAAASAGTQYVNQNQANKKRDAAETQALINQGEKRQEANAQVKGLIDKIGANSPQQIAAKSTGEFVSQLRKNAAGSTQSPSDMSALPPNIGGSSRYSTDAAKSQRDVQAYGNDLATELGGIDAAVRQRQGEALGLQTLGTNLNTINLGSYGQNFVDQLRAQAAGQMNPWLTLGSNLLGGTANQIALSPDAYFTPSAGKYGRYGGKAFKPVPQYDGWEGALA